MSQNLFCPLLKDIFSSDWIFCWSTFVKMSFGQMSWHLFSQNSRWSLFHGQLIFCWVICQNVIWWNVSAPFLSPSWWSFLQWQTIFYWLPFVKMLFGQMSWHLFSPLLIKFSQVTDNNWMIVICQNVIWPNVLASFLSEFSMKFILLAFDILLIVICQNVIWSNVSAPFLSPSWWSFHKWQTIFDHWYLSKCHLKKCLDTFSPPYWWSFLKWQIIFCWLPFVKMLFGKMSRNLFSRNSKWSFFHWHLISWWLPFAKMSFD